MTTARKIYIVAGSMVITAMLVLGLARLPVAYPLQATLNVTAERWLGNSFEDQLVEQLDSLLYQQHRPMLYQLAMQQLAEQARLERVRAISRADRHNWWALQRASTLSRQGFAPLPVTEQHGRALTPRVQSTPRPETRRDLLVAIVCFVFVIGWALARRP